jgi:disulfide bond formation protein DsbB
MRIYYYLAWLTSLIATSGSLFFSEILKFPPCILCWYQRILLYPLVFIIAVGILRKDKSLPYYVLPLTISGTFISIYHNLLYYNILPESTAPCTLGISCTTKFIELFGFVTIPLLSLLAFLFITGCMFLQLRYNSQK